MEVGNILFGNSRGDAPIPRERAWKTPLFNFLQEAGLDGYGNPEQVSAVAENDVFTVRPYYWGDCICGYEEKACAWSDEHSHAPDCYQALYRMLPLRDGISPADDAVKVLCASFNIAWNKGYGSAVHCTCDYEGLWEEFGKKNDHAATCPIVSPNFLHKPSGFAIKWYKYPLRDSYMSPAVDIDEYRRIFRECVQSLNR